MIDGLIMKGAEPLIKELRSTLAIDRPRCYNQITANARLLPRCFGFKIGFLGSRSREVIDEIPQIILTLSSKDVVKNVF